MNVNKKYRFGLPWKFFFRNKQTQHSQLRQNFVRSLRDVGLLVSSGWFRAELIKKVLKLLLLFSGCLVFPSLAATDANNRKSRGLH